MTALFKACYWGEADAVRVLLSKKNCDKEHENQAFNFVLTPLTAALFKNHLEIAKMLLWAGADPFKAEKLMFMKYKVFRDNFKGDFERLFEFYKRWHKGKKQILFALYCA
mmetsp:Transcript_24750/g.21935  ORF Transcript_24750/g.21935 Transcript_24750/m.21935 type:complete len:110 (-) Transcript_24750:269-598(-)|eukprot:CAMPEP_0114588322 /NCGR_PEP_ID=MMETSP0125-20121206/11049_1 /TAXON_ID=485358 ORGANISM="Aristerostoma sp., Strain ATCC 50986" /NCGR_SAMPLE_ID=MMETSP0125 /ASSEMBLY_ACC=CAM_ASM_000245 /LENGTH=109 /DNA_ID=CAMNT_0001784651 /DNA_START=340 /DNA_END=669 /DNA_ORIENTATION=+